MIIQNNPCASVYMGQVLPMPWRGRSHLVARRDMQVLQGLHPAGVPSLRYSICPQDMPLHRVSATRIGLSMREDWGEILATFPKRALSVEIEPREIDLTEKAYTSWFLGEIYGSTVVTTRYDYQKNPIQIFKIYVIFVWYPDFHVDI